MFFSFSYIHTPNFIPLLRLCKVCNYACSKKKRIRQSMDIQCALVFGEVSFKHFQLKGQKPDIVLLFQGIQDLKVTRRFLVAVNITHFEFDFS